MRVCEAELMCRGIMLYSTPASVSDAQRWVRTGWELYQRLASELGYRRLTDPGPVELDERPTLIEVHPHGCFVVGLGWLPRNKETLSGQLERAAYLLRAARWGGEPLVGDPVPRPDFLGRLSTALGQAAWDGILAEGIEVPSLAHDVLDSLAGLITAIRGCEGRAFALGDPDEGLIVLPSEPKARYSRPKRKADIVDARN